MNAAGTSHVRWFLVIWLFVLSAASCMTRSVTRVSQQYQLFQPISGVNPKVSPQTILKLRRALPRALDTRNTTAYSPRWFRVPMMRPVWGLTLRPAGRFSTVKVMGAGPSPGW